MQVNPAKIKDESIKNLRENGYLVVVFSPEELENVPRENLRSLNDAVISFTNNIINEYCENDD